jgi:hypothetical protein
MMDGRETLVHFQRIWHPTPHWYQKDRVNIVQKVWLLCESTTVLLFPVIRNVLKWAFQFYSLTFGSKQFKLFLNMAHKNHTVKLYPLELFLLQSLRWSQAIIGKSLICIFVIWSSIWYIGIVRNLIFYWILKWPTVSLSNLLEVLGARHR